MDQSVEIIINHKDLELCKSGNIIGEIYFSFDGGYFPGYCWSDFIVPILDWWLQAVSNFKMPISNITREFIFMDGPYLVRGRKNKDESIDFSFIEKRLKGEYVLNTASCSIKGFESSLITASKRLVNALRRQGWNSDEITCLINRIENWY